jgi:hypothetical protein
LSKASKSNPIDDLRAERGDIAARISELIAERDTGVAYLAHVDKDAKAIARLAEINNEIESLKTRDASLEPALAEALRREKIAREEAEAEAEARRQNAREAEALCADAEAIAEKLDAAFAAVRQHAQEFEDVMGAIRRKAGVGPQFDHIRVFLARALRTATVRSPLHIESISPVDQTTVSQVAASWLGNIRVHIGRTLSAKTAAKEAA